MSFYINILQTFGDQMLEYVLFPLLVWTLLALLAVAVLQWTKIASPVFQYHSRIALMLALPLGIGGSLLINLLSSVEKTASPVALFVVNNPVAAVAVSPDSGSSAMSYGPGFWLGILGMIFFFGALFCLYKLISHYGELRKIDQRLDFELLSNQTELAENLSDKNKRLNTVQLAYSNAATVPFTYGWRNIRIVIPSDLKSDSENLTMAVQHELTHIQHRDYLLNSILNIVKATLWFHPLLHHLHNSLHKYREIICDNKVLANQKFSKKSYATLLYKLAKREHNQELAMSMAVNPSSLKKRINTMSSKNNISSRFRFSLVVTLITAFLIVTTMSCTDIADDGIKKSELDESQAKMLEQPTSSEPLYVVNGEQWNGDNDKKIARLKSKYIKSINVLKGDKATKKYGEEASNGVLEMNVTNPEKAFNDLRTEEQVKKDAQEQQEDFFQVVEQMPQPKGGIAKIQKEVNYPEKAQQAGIEGRVTVQFIVNKQGNVEDPEVIRGIGAGCDEEALRVIKQTKFEPGMQNGEKAPVQFSVPITFQLPDSNQ